MNALLQKPDVSPSNHLPQLLAMIVAAIVVAPVAFDSGVNTINAIVWVVLTFVAILTAIIARRTSPI